ncbi:MAG: phage tail tape measure protein [Candidatus Lokiarchaeota archaeon]
MAFKAGAIYGEAILDTKKWSGGLNTLLKGTKNVMKLAVGAATAYFVKSVHAANQFQKEMSNVATIIDETSNSTQQLTLELFKTNPALGKTTELTKGLYQAYSSGAKTMETAMEDTVASAKFAKAGLTETSTALDVLTSTVNAYGRETISTTQASDIFFTAIKEGKLTGESLAGSIGDSIPLFASAKIDVKELASGMAAMTKQGVSANEATTQLNAIINSLLKPSSELTKVIKAYGYESGSALLESEGLSGALKILEKQTEGDSSSIAKLVPNIRGMKGVMALTGVGGKEFTRILEEMDNSAGATEEAFNKQEKTFETLTASLDKGSIIIGNIGKAFVDEIAVGATAASESMISFLISSKGAEVVSTIIGHVVAGFEALKIILEPLVRTVLKELSNIWNTLSESLDKISGKTEKGTGVFNAFAFSVQLLSSVFKIVSIMIQATIKNISNLIVAIKESGATIGYFFEFLAGKKSWEEVQQQAGKTTEAFKTLGTEFIEGYSNLFDTVFEEATSFGKKVNEQTSAIEVKYKTTFKNIKDGTKESYLSLITGQDDFINALSQGADEINSVFNKSNDDVVDDTKKTIEDLEMTWKDYFNLITDATSHVTSGIFDIFSSHYDEQQRLLDEETQRRLEKLDEQYENEKLTTEEYEKQKKKIEDKAKKESNKIAKKQFMAEKLNNISTVWMNAGTAISGWWSAAPKLGPIAGPIFAGTMTGATLTMAGIRTGQIAKQKFIPTFEKGGKPKNTAIINEVGGEIVTLPDNSQIIPHDISEQIASNTSSNINIYFYFKGANISKDMDLDYIVTYISQKLGKELRFR